MSSVTLTYIAVRIVPQNHVTYGNTETPTTPPAITLTKKRVQNISVDTVKTTVAAKFLEVIERICCNCEGFIFWVKHSSCVLSMYRGADKSLARWGRKQVTATEDFEFRMSYL